MHTQTHTQVESVTPVCNGLTVSFNIKATDQDLGEKTHTHTHTHTQVESVTPVCNGLTVSFNIKATDQDLGENVTIVVTDSTGDGQVIWTHRLTTHL